MASCSKPRCARPAYVLLAYDYATRAASLHEAPAGEISPHLYALCAPCAARLTPPRGWTLEDRRDHIPEELFPHPESLGTFAT